MQNKTMQILNKGGKNNAKMVDYRLDQQKTMSFICT